MKMLKVLTTLAAVLLVSACGGGGGSSGSNVFAPAADTPASGIAATTATVGISLSTSTVTSAVPATVTVTVVDGNGGPVAGKVVSFSTVGGLGAFSSSTALTNAAGVATVALYPATSTTSGADTVTASITVNGAAVQATRGFQLTATDVTISSFASDVPTLSAYGQATLTVAVSGGAPGTPVSISLNSLCVAKNKATLTPTSLTTTTGTASFTYKDQGCGATDATDSLTATVVGSAATRPLTQNLSAPAASNITFSSASPETIYLKGSGFTETSLVTFQVRDLAGNALPNQSVVLEATTLSGGLTLDGASVAVTKVSDSSGNVTARINSGTVPTPVRVRATLGSTISTVSSNLSVAVGLPSQLNFSMSQGTFNIEGYNIDGTPNTYSIIASDRLGNPVPVGTTINFVTEGGQVEPSRQIASVSGLSRATANFVSAEPRPVNGRVSILAYALGEESFLDTNGNNVFDAGEAFQDLGDLYIDRAYDGVHDPVSDQFISLSIAGNSACAAVDPTKDPLGLLGLTVETPSRPGTCDGGWGRAYARRAVETVLSTSKARPFWASFPGSSQLNSNCSVTTLTVNATGGQSTFYNLGGGTLFDAPAIGTLSILAADANPVRLNPMAAGTVITATATTGLSVVVEGGSPVANSADVTSAGVGYEFAAGVTSGTIHVSFKSPGGLTTTVPVSIKTTAPTSTCGL